jgi:hypothetical protein
MAKGFDHAIVNLPLGHAARGGSIDAQIDRHIRQQRAADRAMSRANFRSVRLKKAHVKQLLARIGDWRIMQIAKPLGCRKPSTARAALATAAMSNLDRWITSLEREQFPAGGCAACWAPLGQCDHSDEEWLGTESRA